MEERGSASLLCVEEGKEDDVLRNPSENSRDLSLLGELLLVGCKLFEGHIWRRERARQPMRWNERGEGKRDALCVTAPFLLNPITSAIASSGSRSSSSGKSTNLPSLVVSNDVFLRAYSSSARSARLIAISVSETFSENLKMFLTPQSCDSERQSQRSDKWKEEEKERTSPCSSFPSPSTPEYKRRSAVAS